MTDELAPELRGRLLLLAAEGRDAIERSVCGSPSRGARLRRGLMRALGAIAVGTFAAGFAIFVLVVVLNLIFHFAPP